MDVDIQSLVKAIENEARSKGFTIATAESLTAGNIQAALGSVSGASHSFVGGVCAYNIDQKVALLGVDREHAAAFNCVAPRVALEMAEGCLRLFKADIAVATTGYAEPDPDQGVTSPHAHICVVRLWNTRINSAFFIHQETATADVCGHSLTSLSRQEMQQLVTVRALLLLAQTLGLNPDDFFCEDP